MKLLKKSTIQTELANQRKQQIDEGVSIAQKVDTLRETLASLEKQHSTFVGGMEKELHIRTDSLIQTIAEKEHHLENLEEKRKELLKPLNHEWELVKAKDFDLQSGLSVLADRLLQVSRREEKVVEVNNEVKIRLSQVKVRERELERAILRQRENIIESDKALGDATLRKMETDKYVEDKNKSLLTREAQIAVRERENQLLSESLLSKEEQLKKKEIILIDREKTLERELTRQHG